MSLDANNATAAPDEAGTSRVRGKVLLRRPRTLKELRESRCRAWARSKSRYCKAKAMHNGVCRVHGGLSTGPRTPAGRARVGAAQAATWARWRAERGLPEDWRYSDSRGKGARVTAAQWLSEHGEKP